MGILRRSRDVNNLCFVFFGCAVTAIYFLVLANFDYNRSYKETSGNFTKINYEYEEICREWKIALDREASNNQAEGTKLARVESAPDLDYEISVEVAGKLNSNFLCDNSFKDKVVSQRGHFYVIYNFVKAEKEFGCTESVTLSAPGDYRFLDNVIPLVDRWNGPISIALYAPGDDFFTTLRAIAYLRNCVSSAIRELVSFHLVFEQEHTPKQKKKGVTLLDSYIDDYDCSLPPPWQDVNDENMYKTKHALLYPINLVRNVAKLAAQTYFIFPSDIELYPTRKFVPLFLNFVLENLDLFKKEDRNVFVLPIFEILENQSVPETKNELLAMLKDKSAFIFHQKVCAVCHRVIDSEKWVKTPETEGLGVFSIGKRIGRYMVWEPFFVCTQREPLWDERMSWEGQSNKMIQAYTMCLMDYNFYVLDNAFLIHKPGVKKKKVQIEKFKSVVHESTARIRKIAVELQELYGYSNSCTTKYVSVMKKGKKVESPKLTIKTKKS